jgi:hypothetical protein
MQVVWTFYIYIVTWLMCQNIYICSGIFEYYFDMATSWDMWKNNQFTSSEHVRKYSHGYFREYSLIPFHVHLFMFTLTHSWNNILVTNLNYKIYFLCIFRTMVVNLINFERKMGPLFPLLGSFTPLSNAYGKKALNLFCCKIWHVIFFLVLKQVDRLIWNK